MESRDQLLATSEQVHFIRKIARRAMAFAGVSSILLTPHVAEAAPNYDQAGQVATGEVTNAVIVADLPDPSVPPLSIDEAKALVYNGPESVHGIFSQESFGRLQFKSAYDPTGDAYGPVQIQTSFDETCSNSEEISKAAYEAAQQSTDKDLSVYDNYTVIIPRQEQCDFGGISLGNVALINHDAPYIRNIVVHELGHNLGIGHARSRNCTERDGTITIDTGLCNENEYGNTEDYMGDSKDPNMEHHFSGYEKARLGWTSLTTIRKNSTITIPAIDTPSPLPHAARVLVSKRYGWAQYLYADYHAVRNFIPDEFGIAPTRGVTIRKATSIGHSNDGGLPTTMLYDTTPVSFSKADAPLRKGKTFTSKEGVRFKVLTANDTAATVRITGAAQALNKRNKRHAKPKK